LAERNYRQAKRQKELARKARQEEKSRRRAERVGSNERDIAQSETTEEPEQARSDSQT
jgi:type IV secretory pathway VirB9-like protein